MIELVDISEKYKESLIRILNKDEVQKWLANTPFPYTEKDADEFIEGCKNLDKTNEFRFAIELEGVHIGGIGLRIKDDGTGETGYYLDSSYWRKGYASEALNRILNIAFEELKLCRVGAYTFEGNISSQKLLLKSGFKEQDSSRIFTKGGESYKSKYFFKDKN